MSEHDSEEQILGILREAEQACDGTSVGKVTSVVQFGIVGNRYHLYFIHVQRLKLGSGSSRRFGSTGSLPSCDIVLKAPKPKNPGYPKEPKTLGDHIRKCRFDRGLT